MPNEIGYQSIPFVTWGLLAAETAETNPDLIWPRSIEIYDQMRREDGGQIGSVLRAVTLPIRAAAWRIDPAGARQEVVDLVANDLGLPVKGQDYTAPLRTRDRFSWSDHLRMALLELVHGHSYFEQVYTPIGNREHLQKLAWRPPRTIAEIDVASDGGLVAIKQHSFDGKPIVIPVDRLVGYVNEREGGNWLGQSLLRGVYKNWLLKDRALRTQAMTGERNGLGVPVYTAAPVPEGVTPEQRDEWLQSEKDAGLDVTTHFRAGEAAGASIPNGAELKLLGVEGNLPDLDVPIRYHDEQIARAVLAHFLNLGTQTGSWALGTTFADFFTASLNAVGQQIADTTQQHVVEDLVDLNWGPEEPAPRLVFDPIGSEFPATAASIQQLVTSGVLQPDDELEAYLRSAYGLPMKGANPRPRPQPPVQPAAVPQPPATPEEPADGAAA